MRIASKSLMSIKLFLASFFLCPFGRPCLFVGEFDLGAVVDRAHGRVLVVGSELHALEVVERLVGRERQLAVLVDAILALLDLLARRLPRGRAERAGREVDAELLCGAEQL